jgi:hypothetical protein
MKEYIPILIVVLFAAILFVYVRHSYYKEFIARGNYRTIRRFFGSDAEAFIQYLERVRFLDYEKLNYCLKQIGYRGYASRSDLMDLFSMNLSTFSKDNIKVERMEISEVRELIKKRYLRKT